MSDRRDLHVRIHEFIYYMACVSHSGNHITLTLCSHCIAVCKTQHVYKDMKSLAHISKNIVCSRCLAFHPQVVSSLYSVTEADIKTAMDTEKGIDIPQSGLTLFIHSFSSIIKPD